MVARWLALDSSLRYQHYDGAVYSIFTSDNSSLPFWSLPGWHIMRRNAERNISSKNTGPLKVHRYINGPLTLKSLILRTNSRNASEEKVIGISTVDHANYDKIRCGKTGREILQ
ncbi:hypothetical protein ABKN59_004200 [Abortiporus biennis]